MDRFVTKKSKVQLLAEHNSRTNDNIQKNNKDNRDNHDNDDDNSSNDNHNDGNNDNNNNNDVSFRRQVQQKEFSLV
jgi:hypothetical protein